MSGFGFRTKNIKNDIQKKSVILGRDIGWAEVHVYAVFAALGVYFAFIANISLIWSILSCFLCYVCASSFTTKYKNRTLWQWFRIFIRKQSRGNISIDRGADYSYFVRTK